jgi:hypothetical protein
LVAPVGAAVAAVAALVAGVAIGARRCDVKFFPCDPTGAFAGGSATSAAHATANTRDARDPARRLLWIDLCITTIKTWISVARYCQARPVSGAQYLKVGFRYHDLLIPRYRELKLLVGGKFEIVID